MSTARADIERTFDGPGGKKRVGLIVPPSSVAAVHRGLIIGRTAQEDGFPAIFQNRRYAADGGLMSYGIDRVEQYRRVASYVDHILKGESPADLPVRQQEKFEFVLNLKTAKTLGIDVPRVVLRAGRRSHRSTPKCWPPLSRQQRSAIIPAVLK